MVQFFEKGNSRIAYTQHESTDAPGGFIFLHGFGSDQEGMKALTLHQWAQDEGYDCLRFDMRGHGQSSEKFEDCTLSMWIEDALTLLDHVAKGPQIVIGSSMGGWIALKLALLRPERIKGVIGLAAAPDFLDRLMWETFPADVQQNMIQQGFLDMSSPYAEGYHLTHALIQDARQHNLLTNPCILTQPVHLLHGSADDDVPLSYGLELFNHLEAPESLFTIIKDGDHRLSRDQDLERLIFTAAEMAVQVF